MFQVYLTRVVLCEEIGYSVYMKNVLKRKMISSSSNRPMRSSIFVCNLIIRMSEIKVFKSRERQFY